MKYQFHDPEIDRIAAEAARLKAFMASAHIYSANNSVDQVTVAATIKTMIQLISAATRRVWVKEFSIAFKSVTATDVPCLVQIARQSTAGTVTAIGTLAPDVEGHPAAITTASELVTAEPTIGVILRTWEITPIGGQLVYQLPLGDEIEMAVSSRLGFMITTPQIQNCRAYIKFNE
jgi:hypothetical protein